MVLIRAIIFIVPTTAGSWQHVNGKLKQVDIDGNTVCGVSQGDNIYCKDNLTGSDWRHIPGN